MACRGSLGSNAAISTEGAVTSFTRVHDESVFDALSWCCSVYHQSTVGARSWTVRRVPAGNDTCFLFDEPYPVNDLPAFGASASSNVSSGGDPCHFGRLEVNSAGDDYSCACDASHSGKNCDFDLDGVIISMTIIGFIFLLILSFFVYRCGRRRAINDAKREADEEEEERLRVEKERYDEVAETLLVLFKYHSVPLTEAELLKKLADGIRVVRRNSDKDDDEDEDNEKEDDDEEKDDGTREKKKRIRYKTVCKLEKPPSSEELVELFEKMFEENKAATCDNLDGDKVYSIPDKVHVFEIKVSIIATLKESDDSLSEEAIHANLKNVELQKAISNEQILGFLVELRREKQVVRRTDEEDVVWTVPEKVPELTEHYLKGLFALMDDDNSGTVDIYELGGKLGNCGIDNNMGRLIKLLHESDAENRENYNINEDEFIALVQKQQWVLPEDKVFGKNSMLTTAYLHYIFGIIDHDANGVIDMKELMEALERCEIKVDEDEMLQLLPKPEGDAIIPSIGENDFMVLVRQKEWILDEIKVIGDLQLSRAHLSRVFNVIDDNKNGRVSLAEVKWMLEHNNIMVDLTELVKKMNTFETDNELGINEQDFVSLAQRQRWILGKVAIPNIPEFDQDYLGKIFKLMDTNKNDRVCVSELIVGLQKCNIETNVKQLVSILSKPGADEDYGVREGDFIDIIRKAGWVIKEENLRTGFGSWAATSLKSFAG